MKKMKKTMSDFFVLGPAGPGDLTSDQSVEHSGAPQICLPKCGTQGCSPSLSNFALVLRASNCSLRAVRSRANLSALLRSMWAPGAAIAWRLCRSTVCSNMQMAMLGISKFRAATTWSSRKGTGSTTPLPRRRRDAAAASCKVGKAQRPRHSRLFCNQRNL